MEKTLKSLCESVSCKITGAPKLPWNKQSKWQQEAQGYRLQLRYQRRAMSIDFWQGTGIKEDPTSARVLDCLLSDASALDQDFEEWCADLGYETDSRKALATFRACQRTDKQVKRLLDIDYEIFWQAER